MPDATLSPPELAEILHELRSPLGGIESMIGMLEASALDDGQREIMTALKASAAHLRGIADRVLGDSCCGKPRPEGKDAAKDHEGDCLAEFLGVLEISARARCASRGLEFVAEHAADPGLIFVMHQTGLRQVIENLLDNAVRLTESGCVTLSTDVAKDGRMQFHILDQGPGLSEDEALRLIRDGGGIVGRKGGAGLGLSIAGRIVAGHGGSLRGGPAPDGHGACFTFDWPVQCVAMPEHACLIVDDHRASRLVLKTILGAAGYPCVEAPDVAAAVRQFEAQVPALVLTDINMPDGDGLQLVRAISGMGFEAPPKIIVVSADEIDLSAPEHAGIDGAIRKPVTVRAVLDVVRSVLATDPRREAA
jgi:CheY-like chemotaxis protein